MAPFWRGLNDFKDEWTEHQLVAAGRGLPIPAADEIPPEELTRPISPDSAHTSTQNLQNLMVPITARSHSAASDASSKLSPGHPAFSNASTSSPPTSSAPTHSSSPFRPRSKTLASLTTSSKNASTEMVPREIQLPKDPFVNGQAIEVFLYKDATECPICFLYYPPYLNKTRCCDQPICSECFVQIKRPDPHPPEHEQSDPSNPTPAPPDDSIEPESLVSEPATCPYCQQPEFGVTYDAPPFRRGLSYANPPGLASFSSAMSSSSSLNSSSSPTTLAPQTHKRRTTSISATAATVITTDRVRPDWATKLSTARSHLARRSAAATALHTAAYLIGNGNTENRSFGFTSRTRFGRNRGESSPGGASGSATPSAAQEQTSRSVSDQIASIRREAQENGGSRRRSRMDDLEEMMMMEAIRLSLAAEEERKKKTEKKAAKEAKKRAKEDKKREKKERKGVYGSGASSASGSALSLSLPGLGRRRGNSGASNLAREVTPEDAEPTTSKGKGVDRSPPATSSPSAPIDFPRAGNSSSGIPGARHLDTSTLTNIQESQNGSSSPTAPDKPSHLRQMSTASSPASSFMESIPGSLRNDFHGHGSSSSLDTPNASGTNIAGHTSGTPEGGDSSGNAGSEPMFNFQSLAAMIGHEDEDKADAARHIEHLHGGPESSSDHQEGSTSVLEESVATLKIDDVKKEVAREAEAARQTTLLEPQSSTPEVLITPVTPAALNHDEHEGKQLGSGWTEEYAREITQ